MSRILPRQVCTAYRSRSQSEFDWELHDIIHRSSALFLQPPKMFDFQPSSAVVIDIYLTYSTTGSRLFHPPTLLETTTLPPRPLDKLDALKSNLPHELKQKIIDNRAGKATPTNSLLNCRCRSVWHRHHHCESSSEQQLCLSLCAHRRRFRDHYLPSAPRPCSADLQPTLSRSWAALSRAV